MQQAFLIGTWKPQICIIIEATFGFIDNAKST